MDSYGGKGAGGVGDDAGAGGPDQGVTPARESARGIEPTRERTPARLADAGTRAVEPAEVEASAEAVSPAGATATGDADATGPAAAAGDADETGTPAAATGAVPPRPGAVPAPSPEAGAAGAGGGVPHGPRAGIAALSLPYQVVAAVALAMVAVFACVHLAMVFLHVAPSNTLTKQHGEAVDDWVYPEFEQNWKLFAPNPLQQNNSVEVRAQIAGTDGGRRTTGWIDLSAQDAERIRGSLLPSHTEQNELRRAWDFYLGSHTEDHRPNGMRGELSERYMRRIVMLRLDEKELGGRVQKIQLRSVSRPVPAPAWSTEKADTRPAYRSCPWWRITAADRPAGATVEAAR
ncbi:DUF5819 family protein [Streptomyces sp. NPDC048018]|uniref:DUF5819 family protein n=1 Tax=Streptomyces sp. NPDC048018 TaxID=3365499 RepID=UPI003722F3BC